MSKNIREKNFCNLRIFLAKNHLWIGFIIVAVALLYAFVTVLFEPRHILLDIIYGLLFVFLISGLYVAFVSEKQKTKPYRWDLIDGVTAALGVLLTYFIVHLFDLNIVIASSLVGVVGHFLLRKYETPIYCGSFAGMASVALFDYMEVAILALICALIYLLTKPLFSGYGGKLGTIAFMSSLILQSIFNDEFLSVQVELHFALLIMASIFGVVATFYLQHLLSFTAVLASAALSFFVSLVAMLLLPQYFDYVVVIFSASFIGMSSKDKLPNLFFVVLAGVILGLVYYVFVHYFNGLGGKLGLMALISVMITTGFSRIFMKKIHFHHHLQKKS